MPSLVRSDPETSCQPNDAHHPHLLVCGDYEDNCWDDYGDGRGFMPYHILACCLDDQEWPCDTKKKHIQERKEKHVRPHDRT